jgi:putative tricarboxylic transport membrane protein
MVKLMEELQNLLQGFTAILNWEVIFWCFLGVTVGTLVGTLPGLGPTTGIAVLLPLSFKLDSLSALMLLMGIYQGVMYGGRISSILINVPGEAAAVVSAFDGYPMAKQGKAGYALALSAIASFFGGTIGFIGLVFLTPYIANWALFFGPVEYFALVLFALISMCGTGQNLLKGLITIGLGLVLSMVGGDPIESVNRLTFGMVELWDGISFVVVAIGLFGISEVLINLESSSNSEGFQGKLPYRDLFPRLKQMINNAGSIFRGSVIGFIVGVLPGAGSTIATFISYDVEKKLSKNPEKFGSGVDQGLSAPEAANNASIGGALVPLFSMGIPGSGTTAILLGALIILGLQPGPLMFERSGDLIWATIAGLMFANLLLLILNTAFVPAFTTLIQKALPYLNPLIAALCIIGTYLFRNSFFDVGLMIIFGILGYFMKKYEFPLAVLILSLVLGEMLEVNFRQALLISQNDLSIFFTRPISLIFILLSIGILLYPFIKKGYNFILKKGFSEKA